MGQDRILAEQVGGGEVQLKVPPGGVDDNTMLVLAPEQIVFENGAFTAGTGLMVIYRDSVCPELLQLILDPYTWISPAVALNPKSTVI